MAKKLLLRVVSLALVLGVAMVVGAVYYLFHLPHRDVQAAQTDYALSGSQIVSEYLADKQAANQKYLAADGNSKILEVTGTVSKISENFNNQVVVLLKEKEDMAGVSATFTEETNPNARLLGIGQKATVKGVIRSGASYDGDLGLYENVILEKCDVVK